MASSGILQKKDPTQINAPGQVGFGRNHQEGLQVCTSHDAAQVVSALLGKLLDPPDTDAAPL
jgi:hypothetical protein